MNLEKWKLQKIQIKFRAEKYNDRKKSKQA